MSANTERDAAPPAASGGAPARFGAAGGLLAPRWVTCGVVSCLVALSGLTLILIGNLETREMARVLEEQGRRTEKELGSVVDLLSREQPPFGLEAFGERLVGTARWFPGVLDIVLLTPEREVVRRFSRDGKVSTPCAKGIPFPLTKPVDHQHPPGVRTKEAVGCLVYPVIVEGREQGAVLFHTERDWSMEGARVGGTVRRTVWRLLPVFAFFYVLLAVLLVAASRAARRWRLRAAAAERVEALGAIADGINHEIRNPLNSVVLSLQYLGRKHDDPESRKVVETAAREAERIGATLKEFARFTRVSRLEIEEVALDARLRERARGRAVPVDVSGRVAARVDRRKMDDAFDAVLDLLERHAPAGGRTRLELEAAGDGWQFEATGGAEGFDAAGVARLFDPYVRAGECDVGRGLALARAVFQSHGGDLMAAVKGNRLVLLGYAPSALPGERE